MNFLISTRAEDWMTGQDWHGRGPVSISLRERIGLALINAPDLVAVLAPHARHVIVLHGHRHTDSSSVCGDIILCSAPSTSLGSNGIDKYQGSFHIHRLSATTDRLQPVTTEPSVSRNRQ
jgi:hypothetical protein